MATAAPLPVKHQAAGVRPVVVHFTSDEIVHQDFGVGKRFLIILLLKGSFISMVHVPLGFISSFEIFS